MITDHQFLVLFLIVSAVGSTIIVSKGDIFKGIRDWIELMSHKNKRFIHDISVPANAKILSVSVDKKDTATEIDLSDYEAIKTLFYNIPTLMEGNITEVDRVRVERDNHSTRIFIEMKKKHVMSLRISGNDYLINNEFGVYENSERIAWVKFISDLWSCPQCTGVWLGWAWYTISWLFGLINHFNFFVMFSYGCTISVLAYFYFKLYSVCDKYINQK